MAEVRLTHSGDRAILVEFENRIAPEINRSVRSFCAALEARHIAAVTEVVPAYRAVTVHYRPEELFYEELAGELRAVLEALEDVPPPEATVWELPVLYGGEAGPDLGFVARHTGLAPAQVVDMHTRPEYLVYMLGFMPGFPYLGGMEPALAAPRLSEPRVKIPAGSVGIAGEQTGVYPVASPGGWRLIGRTPVALYDPARREPVLVQAGDYVKFRAVEQGEYEQIARQVAEGTYVCRRWPKEG